MYKCFYVNSLLSAPDQVCDLLIFGVSHVVFHISVEAPASSLYSAFETPLSVFFMNICIFEECG